MLRSPEIDAVAPVPQVWGELDSWDTDTWVALAQLAGAKAHSASGMRMLARPAKLRIARGPA